MNMYCTHIRIVRTGKVVQREINLAASIDDDIHNTSLSCFEFRLAFIGGMATDGDKINEFGNPTLADDAVELRGSDPVSLCCDQPEAQSAHCCTTKSTG
jgi:hypothetical protein